MLRCETFRAFHVWHVSASLIQLRDVVGVSAHTDNQRGRVVCSNRSLPAAVLGGSFVIHSTGICASSLCILPLTYTHTCPLCRLLISQALWQLLSNPAQQWQTTPCGKQSSKLVMPYVARRLPVLQPLTGILLFLQALPQWWLVRYGSHMPDSAH